MDPITNPEKIAEIFTDYDWHEASTYASWNPEDVAAVIAMEEGENDGSNLIMVVKLKDGRFSLLSAGYGYTGWDCQAGGHSLEYGSLEELIRMGLGQEERERLSMPIPD